MTTQRRTFTLDSSRDAAILACLDAESNLSEVVRNALREHYAVGVTLEKVYAAVLALGNTVSQPQAMPTSDEDAELVAALANLGI